MATEMAGPVATHPQLTPEGGHPSVGGRGVSGSANSPLVGVSTLGYPSGPADPLDSAMASSTEVPTTTDATTATSTTDTEQLTSRQQPTATEVTAAAFRSPTLMSSKSSAMSPFDRAHKLTTFYSTLIETTRLSCTVFEIKPAICRKSPILTHPTCIWRPHRG